MKFIIETHLRILDTELIKLLKKAGLKGVKVGVESSNPKVLKDANRFTIEKDSQLFVGDARKPIKVSNMSSPLGKICAKDPELYLGIS